MLFDSIRSTVTKLLFPVFLFPTFAKAEIDTTELLASLPAGASAGFIAKNLDTGRIITQYQSDVFMLPASTQKVFTALAAKLALPSDFRFQTALLTNGKVENGIVQGDLIARFTGDPELTSGQLYQLMNELKSKGLTKSAEI